MPEAMCRTLGSHPCRRQPRHAATPPKQYVFIRASLIEAVIWLASVIVSVFGTIEDSIYTKICVSAALSLVRVAMLHGDYLGHIGVPGDPSETEITSSDARDLYVPLLPPPNTFRCVAASASASASASTSVTPAAAGVIILMV
ncbi:hypothetical protein FISHEDRAFT_55045 [Fistulina hepatica ATCC 64428]|uniref:Uncharacterized protein n=1 Tax=Fistulina hepatica ATCC 64428 TaxID=1128425 RepID=A0A0D7APB4_9AGAR|nr:hypothetical protein FISHEDRAFT_55045 [Fistulina hepatica ATCC 64428]